jgi:hypothetical protein
MIPIRGVTLPASQADIQRVDFKGQSIKRTDRALASLAVHAKLKRVIRAEMLEAALKIRFNGDA